VLYPSPAILQVLRAADPPGNVRLVEVGEGASGAEPIAASAVLTSSGTMSMHCALAGIPGAIAYRANAVTYLLGRMLLKVEYLGIANLLLREPMYPEYIQDAANPSALATQLRDATENPDRRVRTRQQSERLRTILQVSASRSAADWLHRQLD
jgi:lipid-A-disaccharide synthase